MSAPPRGGGRPGLTEVSAPWRTPSGPVRARRPARIAAAAVLVLVFALAGVVLVRRASHTVDVLVVARAVPAGHQISMPDLGVARVRGEGFTAIPAQEAGRVVGRTAVSRLLVGQLLQRGMVTDQAVPGPDGALVGLSLRPGQLPGDGLEDGDRVRVLSVPATGAAGAPDVRPVVLASEATVFATHPDPVTAGNTVVTVVVPAIDAYALASFASAGQVSVVEVAAQ